MVFLQYNISTLFDMKCWINFLGGDTVEQNETQASVGCSCSSGCCGTQSQPVLKAPYIKGLNVTMAGAVPRVATELTTRDMVAWNVEPA